MEEAVRGCSASEATLWLLSADETQMDATLNCGRTPEIIEKLSVPVSDSVVGMVASSGQGVSIGPGDYHNDTVDRAVGTDTLAMIATPVHVRGKLWGVLSAINPVGRRLFESADLENLAWRAYLIGLVLGESR